MSRTRTGSGRNRATRCGGSGRTLHLLAFVAAMLLSATAAAIQPWEGMPPKLQRAFIAPELMVQPELAQTLHLDASTPAAPAIESFLRRAGGSWEMRWDLRADRPNLIQGSGIGLLPGRGNDLAADSLGLQAGDAVDLGVVEARLRGFIEANRDLLKTDGLAFELDAANSTPYGDGSTHWFVAFAQVHEGVRVDGAQLFFRLSHGNLVQFGSERVAPVLIDTQPASGRDQAFDLAWRELGFAADVELSEVLEAGERVVLPVAPVGEVAGERFIGTAGSGYEHRLAWRFVFRLVDDPTTYEVLFDAHANRVIEVRNLTLNVDATVTGGIYPTTNTDPEVVVPMPFASVTNNGTKITDALGIYDYTGGTATVTLNGRYFRMSDNCGSISLSNNTTGNLAFGISGGTDCTTPGGGGAGNTHASRTGFYHLTNINRKAVTFLPGNSWLGTTVTANMNVNDQCNAGWNGTSMSFFRSGGGCSNTGEIAAVFLHEWGHGMDQNSGGAASEYGTGEAVGDTFAFLETKDPCIGHNFIPGQPCHNCGTCTGVRDVEVFSTRGTAVVAKPSLITNNGGPNCDRWACPYLQSGIFPYQGPMGYEGHCESYIASSANWDLTQSLVEEFGETQGWQEMDRIWYGSLVPSKSAYRITSGGQCNVNAAIDGCGSSNWYTVFLAADDDNGNLADGTPNACRIWDAFKAHDIACGARPVCTASGAADFTLAAPAPSQSTCAPGSAAYTIEVGSQSGFSAPVTLSTSALPAGVTAAFVPNPVVPGGNAVLTLTASAAAVAGTYPITVEGAASGSPGHSVQIELIVTAGAPTAPTLASPADGATGISASPTLSWNAAANAATYTLQVATDAAFTNIVFSAAGLATTNHGVTGLSAGTTYFWRVGSVNGCGNALSAVRSFTTANLLCATPNAAIPDNNTTGFTSSITTSDAALLSGLKVIVRANHTYVGDLSFRLTRAATSALLVDRPGVPDSSFGCSGDNVDVTLDDAAGTPVETQCAGGPPAISGTHAPNNPIAPFLGQAFAGAWSLTATDGASSDTGTLLEWCLVPETESLPETHTVGGTVAGLAGSGLVLALNGGAQTLPVPANGGFTFPTALATGSHYAVTVASQPSDPSQTCSIANGSGQVGTGDVTNVAVTCVTNTYTVGGNVSGLGGSGFVLSLNGGAQTLAVAANGAFTFPTALASGSSYAVTVATQPASPQQTCTVSGGTGTIGAANVTNVQVSCTTNAYTVGGSVSGLAGSGLVLSLNGGAQTLPVSANGAFTFPTAIASGSSYAVTVATQPSSPEQTCTVGAGTGTIGAANVTDVQVACTTHAYLVGGTVSGLVGSGLELSLNGGAQTLPVAANGSFAFALPLDSGAGYVVDVASQPANPPGQCTIANGSGTVGANDVSDIAVTCLERIFADGFDG